MKELIATPFQRRNTRARMYGINTVLYHQATYTVLGSIDCAAIASSYIDSYIWVFPASCSVSHASPYCPHYVRWVPVWLTGNGRFILIS